MPLHIFGDGEPLPAWRVNALALQTIITVENDAERDGYDFGDEPVTVYRRDKRWCERYYPSIEDDPRGAFLPGWYPIDNRPYVDLYTMPLDFTSGLTAYIGSGIEAPYPYWWRNWDSERWGGTNEGPLMAGPLVPKLQGVYEIKYRTSWDRVNGDGKRHSTVYLNDKEIPGSRMIVSAAVDAAGHATTVLEVPLNGIDDAINFSLMQSGGVDIAGRAFATVSWLRPVQYEQDGWEE